MKKSALVLLLIMAFMLTACSQPDKPTDADLKSESQISRYPLPFNFHRSSLNSVPSYDPNSSEAWQVDLRSYDLSAADIKDRVNDLIYADFDSKTIWPETMPDSFEPQKIMEIGKNPGLGVEKLHKQGITGKGVGIAIIDQALLVDHEEYKDRLKMYEEIHWSDSEAQMHGSAVVSIAVGKTVGVAPEADLYYIAEQNGEVKNRAFVYDFTWLAMSIDRILEVNQSLPKDKKIRVISISVGWDKSQKGYDEVMTAVENAKKQGVFVVSSSLLETYGYMFNGLGKDPLKSPDEPSSYEPGLFWADSYYKNDKEFYSNIAKSVGIKISEVLLVPMDSRTTASPTGNTDYVFYRTGGWSWSIPYIAGLYALACQVNPDITPDVFWTKALETGDTIKIQNSNKEYELKKIVNPARLMDAVKK